MSAAPAGAAISGYAAHRAIGSREQSAAFPARGPRADTGVRRAAPGSRRARL